MFSVFYSPGEGPVPFVYSAESMPLYVRDLGMSMATATLWLFNFLLAVTFPSFQVAFTDSGAFGYYAAWCFVGWFMILFLVYETKDLTLIRYYLLCQRGAVRPVLSVLEDSQIEFGIQMLPPRKLSSEIEHYDIHGHEN